MRWGLADGTSPLAPPFATGHDLRAVLRLAGVLGRTCTLLRDGKRIGRVFPRLPPPVVPVVREPIVLRTPPPRAPSLRMRGPRRGGTAEPEPGPVGPARDPIGQTFEELAEPGGNVWRALRCVVRFEPDPKHGNVWIWEETGASKRPPWSAELSDALAAWACTVPAGIVRRLCRPAGPRALEVLCLDALPETPPG